MSDNPLTGEVSNSKLAAVFDSEAAARAAIVAVTAETGMAPAQVKLVTPSEPHPGIKLEPEGQGIWRTIVRAHLWLGVAGALAGLLAFAVMSWLEIPFIIASPWAAGATLVFFGAIGGLMLGGLVALRPDHDSYILATQEAMAEKRTTVVVHALSKEQHDHAAEILSGRGAEVTRTL